MLIFYIVVAIINTSQLRWLRLRKALVGSVDRTKFLNSPLVNELVHRPELKLKPQTKPKRIKIFRLVLIWFRRQTKLIKVVLKLIITFIIDKVII